MMFIKKSARFLLLLSLAVPALAQVGFTPPDSTPKVTIEGALQKKSGDAVEGTVTATVASGWHINSAKPLEEYAIATVLTIEEGATDVQVNYPAHVMKAFEFTGGKELAVYDGKVVFPFTAKLTAGAAKLRAKVHYQACSDRVCLPPKDAFANIDVNKIVAAAPAASANFTPLSAAPKDAKAKSSLFSSDVSGTFASRGLPLTLLAIFVLGLALNLTPCVYPLIPITIGYFSNQSGARTSRRAALSSLYVLGIAITYSALGVFSALSGKLFGAWLQHPAVLVFFAALMLIMASSMFGAFEIRVPQFISNRSGGQAGLGGALLMGLLIGIVAAPCVGPFVISLIALVSSLQSPFLGFLMFFVLALGLGVPYLFLGIFSSGLSALPRAGEWMLHVKKGMGFVLIAMALYFLRPLIGDFAFQYGVAASLLIGAIFLFMARSQGAKVLRLAIAILLLVSGVAFALPKKHAVEVRWDKYDAKAFSAARAANKPVIIDFYADWCLPCKELDEKTFNESAIAAELNRFVRVKADLTAPNPALTKQYAILGVPTLVFLDANGQEIPQLRLTGFEEPEKFLARLKQVR
jgi:thiol:disulfide interchange protein DsbD